MDFLAPLMFLALFFFFLIGMPVAFSLAISGILFALIAIACDVMSFSDLQSIPDNIWGRVIANDTLLAIPFFTLMGLILERSGMAEKLLDTITRLFGSVRGGMSYAVILVGALLAATTGIVAASVMTMGLIALPCMLRNNYDRQVACGVIAASGTLAQIIPPSLVLIVMADQLGVSVGDMYLGALYPSLFLVGLYAIYITIIAVIRPKSMPAMRIEDYQFGKNILHSRIFSYLFLPFLLVIWSSWVLFLPEQGIYPLLITLGSIFDNSALNYIFDANILEKLSFLPENDRVIALQEGLVKQGLDGGVVSFLLNGFTGTLAVLGLSIIGYIVYLQYVKRKDAEVAFALHDIVMALIPPLILIFLVLGTIFRGIATPTEAGAMGVIGAIILAWSKKTLSMNQLQQALNKTLILSTFVMFILIGARIFTLVFYNLNGHLWVEHLFEGLPGGVNGFLLTINAMIFFLAFFLDFFELIFIVVPLLVPIAHAMGIDFVWLGVMLAMNIQTSFLHPPFGFSLFYLRSVAPNEDYTDSKTGKFIERIKTSQIYQGALPFLFIQIIMVFIIILLPELVSVEHDKVLDLNAIYKQIPSSPKVPDFSDKWFE